MDKEDFRRCNFVDSNRVSNSILILLLSRADFPDRYVRCERPADIIDLNTRSRKLIVKTMTILMHYYKKREDEKYG